MGVSDQFAAPILQGDGRNAIRGKSIFACLYIAMGMAFACGWRGAAGGAAAGGTLSAAVGALQSCDVLI